MESMNLNWMLVNKLSVWNVVQSKAENAIFFPSAKSLLGMSSFHKRRLTRTHCLVLA